MTTTTNTAKVEYEGPRSLRGFAFDVGLWFGAGATLAALVTYATLDLLADLIVLGLKAVLG